MTQQFQEALDIYERIFNGHPSQIAIQAKLIICLTVSGQLNRALYLLADALQINAEYFVGKHNNPEFCPCKDLIDKAEKGELETTSYRKFILLGILWLYCDLEKSLNNFTEAYIIENNIEVFNVLSKISKIIKSKNQLWS